MVQGVLKRVPRYFDYKWENDGFRIMHNGALTRLTQCLGVSFEHFRFVGAANYYQAEKREIDSIFAPDEQVCLAAIKYISNRVKGQTPFSLTRIDPFLGKAPHPRLSI